MILHHVNIEMKSKWNQNKHLKKYATSPKCFKLQHLKYLNLNYISLQGKTEINKYENFFKKLQALKKNFLREKLIKFMANITIWAYINDYLL